MSFFLCCVRAKRNKSIDNYSGSNEQLPQAQSTVRQTVRGSNIHNSKISNPKQVKKAKSSMKHSIVRNKGYSQITNLATGLNMYLTDDELNFKMDYDDGISNNFSINTFHYDIKNEQPGILYYQNVGQGAYQEKQPNPSKHQSQKSKLKEATLFKEKTEEMPTNF